MKKCISLILTLVFVIGACLSAPFTLKVNAADVNDLTFELNSDGVSYSVTDCNSNAKGAIEIPATYNDLPVTSINSNAFSSCHNLTSITMPDSVINIDYAAFYNCTSLTSVKLSNNLLSIERSLFKNCTSLTSITIPDSVTSIANNSFSFCDSLEAIIVSAENKNYSSLDGVLFDKAQTELLRYPSGIKSSAYTIPDTVTNINTYAFENCTALTSINIPDSVKNINSPLFSSCNSLETINVSTGNENFSSSDGILFNKAQTKLLTYPIGINESIYTIPSTVTNIGSSAFENCTALTSVIIPESVTDIGASAFENCTALASIIIPESITDIDSSAFKNCTALTKITFPNTLKSIERNAFSCCTSLTEIILPDSLTYIGDSAFSSCTSLTSITLPDTLINIGDYAFGDTGYYNDANNWENGVIYINNHLIKADSTITDCTIKTGTKYITQSAFSGCNSLTSITIPDTVTSIGLCAFQNCTSLTNITIPDSVTCIESSAFEQTAYYNDTNNWENGVLYINNHLIKADSTITDCTIKSGTKHIAQYAFYYCTALTSVTIPNSVKNIEKFAFYKCTSLTSVTIPDGVTNIDNYVFYNCHSLATLTIPDSVKRIGNYAFYSCKSLTSVTVPDGVTSIGDSAFDSCASLTDLVLPGSLLSIGEYSFSGCRNLDYVFYLGSQEDWEKISPNNFPSTPIHYNTTEHSHFMTLSSALNELLDICPVCNFEHYSESLIWVDDYTTVTDTEDVIIDTTNQYIIVDPSTAAYLKGKPISFYDYKFDITPNSTYGFLGTGTEFKLYNSENTLISEYTAIIRGDINGDSVCDVLDCMLIELARNGNTEISDIHKIAGDFNVNDSIDENDFQSITNLALA